MKELQPEIYPIYPIIQKVNPRRSRSRAKMLASGLRLRVLSGRLVRTPDVMTPPSKTRKVEADGYTLLYWPGIPGRGEFIRLAFEYAGQEYSQDLSPDSVMAHKAGGKEDKPPGPAHFAPPMIKTPQGHIISQTPVILAYLAPKLGLAGSQEIETAWINQVTAVLLDLNNEAHNVHHPISAGLYYEDQKDAALVAAKSFRQRRISQFFDTMERTIQHNSEGDGLLVGKSVSIADLALFHIVEGLKFAFPKALKKIEDGKKCPKVFALHSKIAESENIAAYLKSDRRLPFSDGVFRHYPELDGA